MTYLLWDASGLVKRYIKEVGSVTVNAIFAGGYASPMSAAFLSYAETAAILRRKFNGGLLTTVEFQQARLLLEAEVLLNPGFDLLTITDSDILDGMALTDRHNLNTADAAMLVAYLRQGAAQTSGIAACLLVAADRRLIRAAQAEGLSSLNPEVVPAADLPALLAS